MKFKLKSTLAGVATLAAVGGGFLGMGGAALAAPTTPAWEPDPQAAAPYGNLVFYNSTGQVVTGGTSLSHLFDYAVATTGPDAGATKATLFFAAPNHAAITANWAVTQDGVSTAFPNSAAPAPIQGPGFTNPVVTEGTTGANLTNSLGTFVLDTTAGYANIIQVRLKDTNQTTYWESDIVYNNNAAGGASVTADGVTVAPGSWAQLFPVVNSTTTAISANPASPQQAASGATAGQNVTLTAAVTPATTATLAGTVQFFDGTTAIGTPVALASNSASTTVTAPAFGTHNYSATFVPAGGTEVQGSTSPTMAYVINPPKVATTTSLAGPASAAQYSSVTYNSTVTAADNTTQAGTVQFNATGTGTTTGSTVLGNVSETTGTASLTISQLGLAPGTYNVTAAFTPTNSGYLGSTSPAVALTVTAPSCPGAPDPSGATCSNTANTTVTVNPGSLTITTPYTATAPFKLPDMQLNSTATLLQSSATFPATTDPQIVVHSSLAGAPNWTVTVSASTLSCASGSCKTPVTGQYQSINAENLGLTAGASNAPSTSFPGTVAFTDNAAASGVAPTDAGSLGLGGASATHTFAKSSGGGNGSVSLHGTLSLNAPTATQAGVYTGTISFTVG